MIEEVGVVVVVIESVLNNNNMPSSWHTNNNDNTVAAAGTIFTIISFYSFKTSFPIIVIKRCYNTTFGKQNNNNFIISGVH